MKILVSEIPGFACLGLSALGSGLGLSEFHVEVADLSWTSDGFGLNNYCAASD